MILELNITIENSYIFFYNINEAKVIQSFVMNDYPKNNHNEASSDCQLFFNGNLIFNSKSTGTIIYNLNGKEFYQNKEIYFDKIDSKNNRFYTLNNNSLELFEIDNL